MPSLFVIVLRYLVPTSQIDPHRPAHLEFLDKCYQSGILIASGRQNPANGGVILARADNRKTIEQLFKNDPYWALDLAEYQIFEWDVARAIPGFSALLQQ